MGIGLAADRRSAVVRLSEFRVQASAENGHRAAIGVVGRIGNELIIQRKGRPLVEIDRVVGLEDLLLAVIEPAVADQDAEPAGRNEGPMLGGERIDRAGNADLIVGTAPQSSLEYGPE